jgi:hypothetical protein
MSSDTPRAVLAPDIIGKSFFAAGCWQVMAAWRDGRFTPVVTARLLKQYILLLRGLGLGEELLREWIQLLTAKGISEYVECESEPSTDACSEASELGQAQWIVSGKNADKANHITPEDFLKVL